MAVGDFRFKRYKLPPEAFLVGPEKEPEPSDLVDQRTWRNLVWLTDDVSLRTSEHHGTLLRQADQFLGFWIALVLDLQSLVPEPRNDALALACLDAHDDFHASLFTMLTGFYRQAISALRTAVEAVLTGAYFRTFPDPSKFQLWADGHREGQIWVKEIRDNLKKREPYSQFEDDGHPLLGNGGWVEFLYSRLSAFSHGRPFYTDEEGHRIPTSNVGLWGGSNGPVYEWRAVRLWAAFFWDTALLCLLLVGLAEERIRDVKKPTEMGFHEFVRCVWSWHPGPHPVGKEIARVLAIGVCRGND